ncbi:MAG: hypothetical protein QW175_08025 [Candidatus Bathyarchaeia archaeon]
MKKLIAFAPLLWGLFSCTHKEEKSPEYIVRLFYEGIIYGKRQDVCEELLSNYVYFNILYNQKIRLTKEQAKEVCKEYINYAKEKSLFPIYGIKDYQITLSDIGKDQKLASVFIIMQDGRSEPAGNIKLFKKDNRWYMEY